MCTVSLIDHNLTNSKEKVRDTVLFLGYGVISSGISDIALFIVPENKKLYNRET